MNLVLVKMFAMALALGQVTTRPEAVRTEFDPVYDQGEVADILHEGCVHMRKAFDVEDINLDELIATALEDPSVVAGEMKSFRGINFEDLHLAYRQFCTGEQVDKSPFDLGEVITFYNKTVTDLPDHNRLKGLKLPGTTEIVDGDGTAFAELFESDHRRIWVPLSDLPDYVAKAFVAAEDKRFFQHHGIDERGLIRAFVTNLAEPGRPQGGSTITQQVAKNLLVGDEVSYERKIREMIVAVRLDRALSKNEILEVYVNSIYLGRGAWGIDMAANGYFKKPASQLTVAEAAFLAGMAKGPASFNPDRFPARARARVAYVLNRMQEDKIVTEGQFTQAMAAPPRVAVYDRPRRLTGFHFVDQVVHEARTLVGMQSLTVDSYTVRSTINTKLQRATEAALQEGLARYEIAGDRVRFSGAEMNLSESIQRIDAEQKTSALRRDRIAKPIWQMALQAVRMPLYDVHWTPAVVLETGGRAGMRVGLPDGSILPLAAKESERRQLTQYDVVYVKSEPGKGRNEGRVELRSRPKVQGAAVVLENKTGRVLAMVGGFSYPLSQLNRVTQAKRQPGSSIKPLTYLTALHKGLQPDTLVMDAPVTLPPISGTGGVHSNKYWSPKNYEGGARGVMTLRRALENSRNMVTARLLKGGIADNPKDSLYQICDLAEEAHLYPECLRLYPFILGAQAIRMIDLAGFYAAIANEGAYYAPYTIEAIEQKDGVSVYRHPPPSPTWLAGGDRVAFYQLRTILEGVLTRGTARSLSHFASYAGGKTGTTDNENDAWFASFTKDVTVVVWVGYDNLSGRRTLGAGGTGGHVAAPIADPILQASWEVYPKTPLPPPSAEVSRQVKAVVMGKGEDGGYTEYLRLNANGKVAETKYSIVSRRASDDDESSGSIRYRGEREYSPRSEQPSLYQPYRASPWGGFGMPSTNSVLRRSEDRY